MSRIGAGSLFLGLLLSSGLLAADREAALTVIDRAVKAHGGAAPLVRSQTAVRTARGTLHVLAKEVAFSEELTLQLPERLRSRLEVGEGAQKGQIVQVVNGDKGWLLSGGTVQEIGKERLGELREEAYLLWLTTLLPLQKDQTLELTPLPESKLNDQTVNGVKVASKGHADVKLYFDSKSGLLVKSERRLEEGGVAFDQEYLYSDHKDSDGGKLPTRITEQRNGSKFAEWSEISYVFPRQPDETQFGKP